MIFRTELKKMQKIIKMITVVFIITLTMVGQNVYGASGEPSDEALLNQQLENLNLNELEGVLIGSKNEYLKDFDIANALIRAVKGELGLSPGEIAGGMIKELFNEITELASLMRYMIIIAVLSAIFTNLSSSFKHKSVSELGFYVNFVVVVTLLLSSFSICVGIMDEFLTVICGIMEAATPIVFTLTALAGGGVKAYILNPVLFAATGFVSVTVKRYFSPIILIAATLQMANYLSERDILQKMCDLIKKILGWGMGAAAVLFMSVVALQGISAPIMNNAAVKTAKFAVTTIPVVGPALSSAVDTVIYWSGAVKSGFLVVIVILLVAACAMPIIKIAAFILVYKFTAAIIQPICDPRIVKAIDSLGGFAALMLAACAITGVMFIFMSMIMLS